MVAKNLLEANLKLGSFSTSIKVKLTIEDEEFAFLEREDTEIEAEITIKYKVNNSVKGNNLFLVYCKDRKKYILCSGEDVEKELAIMKKGSGTRLRVEVCCPYSSELEEKLNNTYKVDNWIKLSDEVFGELAMEMVKAREVKTETPKKKKIVVDEKEAKDKEEVEKEENVVGPKPDNVSEIGHPQMISPFLGGELGKLDTKFWLEKIDEDPRWYLLLTINNGEKICYGKTLTYSAVVMNNIAIIEDKNVEDIILGLLNYDGDYACSKKTQADLFNLLLDDSDIMKKVRRLLDKIQENKKYFAGLKIVYEDKFIEVYEKKTPDEISHLYNDYIQTYTTGNWIYHYNIKGQPCMCRLIKYNEKEDIFYGRSDYVDPIISSLLINVIPNSFTVRQKLKEVEKTPKTSYFNREVDYVDIKRLLATYK